MKAAAELADLLAAELFREEGVVVAHATKAVKPLCATLQERPSWLHTVTKNQDPSRGPWKAPLFQCRFWRLPLTAACTYRFLCGTWPRIRTHRRVPKVGGGWHERVCEIPCRRPRGAQPAALKTEVDGSRRRTSTTAWRPTTTSAAAGLNEGGCDRSSSVVGVLERCRHSLVFRNIGAYQLLWCRREAPVSKAFGCCIKPFRREPDRSGRREPTRKNLTAMGSDAVILSETIVQGFHVDRAPVDQGRRGQGWNNVRKLLLPRCLFSRQARPWSWFAGPLPFRPHPLPPGSLHALFFFSFPVHSLHLLGFPFDILPQPIAEKNSLHVWPHMI